MLAVDTQSAIERLMRLLAVEGVTGQEARIGKELIAALKEAGVPARVHPLRRRQHPHPAADPDRQPHRRSARHAAHSRGRSAALHDAHGHRAAVRRGEAEAAGQEDRQRGQDGPRRRQPHRLRRARHAGGRADRGSKLPHPPLTLLFTVREESGLFGAAPPQPRRPRRRRRWASTSTAASAADVIIGAVGADRWEVDIFGKASHAGVAPERGISATMILAVALADVRAGGWFGKVVKDGKQGHQQRRPGRRRQRRTGRRRHQRRHRLTCTCRARAAATTPSSSGRSRPRTRRRSPRRRRA